MSKGAHLFCIICFSIIAFVIMLDIANLIDIQESCYWVWSVLFIIEHLSRHIEAYFKKK